MKLLSAIISSALILASLILFLADFLHGSLIHSIMALGVLLLSLLSGRNIAYLIHDSEVLKRRGKRLVSPAGMLSFWMLMFILAVIFYTLMSLFFFKSMGLLIAGISGSYLGLLYSTLSLAGSYILFRSFASRHPETLRSSWGKRMERAMKDGKNMVNTGMDIGKIFMR